MAAYYNENDPFAAAWLRHMMTLGEVAPGDVDERSIGLVQAEDLRGYDQCHFFAGIGIWSAALRRVGWPDERPIWTGSCPCQPFSAAGKRQGFDDPRHLWPVWFRLITECRPHTILGEQAASAGAWVDLVRTDLEGLGAAFGCPDLPAAGFAQGAHIRQRFYWVADLHDSERWSDLAAGDFGHWPQTGRLEGDGEPGAGVAAGGLAVSQGRLRSRSRKAGGGRPESADDGAGFRLVDADQPGLEGWRVEWRGGPDQLAVRAPSLVGHDWLYCRDGRVRPVEAGTFPLAASHPGRVGLLRGYGNALDLETAANFVGAYLDAESG